MKIKFLIYLFFAQIFFSTPVYADTIAMQAKVVNILTWWGYLDKVWIKSYVREKCHTEISFDEYYTNDEFYRRWSSQKNNYDIIIFEDTFYEVMKNEIKGKGGNMTDMAKDYNPNIRDKFISMSYEPNVLYFFQSTTGVLWNPKTIDIHKYGSIKSMFGAANKNKIVMLDDPQVVYKLIEHGQGAQNPYKEFNDIIKGKDIYISNDFKSILKSPDFSFSYMWSGDAIYGIQESGKNYPFLIDADFSYISSDLIAQVSKAPEVKCVMRALSSKDFLTRLQGDTYYFSPYTDISGIPPGLYRDTYTKYLSSLSSMKWINPVSEKDYERENEEWKLIKLKVNS